MSLYEDFRRIARHAKTYLGELESKELTSEAHRFSFLEAGSGEKLIFLHGVAVSKSSWRTVMHQMYGEFNTIAFDVPGYNYAKDFPFNNYTLRTQASWLDAAISQLANDQVHIVGHSIGAGVAAYYAASYPDRIKSVSLVNLPELFCNPETSIETSMQELGYLWVENKEDFKALMEQFFHIPPTIPDVLINSYIKKMADKRERFDKLLVDTCKSIPLLIPRMTQIKAPLLAITGEYDKYSPPSVLEKIKTLVPHAQTNVFSTSGHLSLIERPESVAKNIKDFINGLATKSACNNR